MAKKLGDTDARGRSTNSPSHSTRKSSHPSKTAAPSSVPHKSGKLAQNSAAVLNGTVEASLADMPKPSQEAVNVNQLLNKNDVNSVPDNLIKQVLEITGCSEHKAHYALHDCNLDVALAIGMGGRMIWKRA